MVLSAPLFAQASVLSFFTSLFEKSATPASAQAISLNSQNIPLLQPAVNIDPHPAKGGGDISVVDGAALLSESGPSGAQASVEEWPTVSQISVYTVHPGDTLSGIAEMFGVSVNTIVWANDLQASKIKPGQVLVILPITGIRHTVVKGETLASIAKKYKGDVDEIAQYNDLSSGAALAVGDTIIVPDGEVTAPPIVKKTSSGVSAPLHGAGGPSITGYYAWPVNGGILTQGLHGYNGIDIGAPTGTSIFASAGGVVIVSKGNGGWNGGYGNYLVIQHDNGTQTLYAHASALLVSAGDRVVQGQTIGKVGMTGKATGSHLHFEVRGAQNPLGY